MPNKTRCRVSGTLAGGWLIRGIAFALALPGAPTPSHALGHQRWEIKTSVPAGKSLTHGTITDLATLMNLPDVPGVTHSDKRYNSKRIPTAVEGHKEGEMVTTKGYLLLVASEDDGDYHIVTVRSRPY